MIWAYRYTEKVIFLARWLTAPFFLVLMAGIFLLICKSFIEFYEVLIHLRTATGKEVIVGMLHLVDFALMANLILIVIFSGYQNFIRRIDLQEHPDWPQDISESDFGGLKLKLLGSIVAIATVEGLEWFLEIEKHSDSSKFAWAIGFQLTFVVSLLLLAGAERLAARKENT
jgi:uncharacterized protein (TIGR00645 family)